MSSVQLVEGIDSPSRPTGPIETPAARQPAVGDIGGEPRDRVDLSSEAAEAPAAPDDPFRTVDHYISYCERRLADRSLCEPARRTYQKTLVDCLEMRINLMANSRR